MSDRGKSANKDRGQQLLQASGGLPAELSLGVQEAENVIGIGGLNESEGYIRTSHLGVGGQGGCWMHIHRIVGDRMTRCHE